MKASKMTNVESGLLAGRVPYLRGGSGDKTACVFFGANALFRHLDRTANPGRYVRQMARLLPNHRVTILGYAGFRFDEIVRDMAHALPVPPDVLVGLSFGGFVAMRFAAQHPELVKRVVLLVSAHRFSPAGWQKMERQFEALEQRDLAALLRENALLFRRPWYNWLVRLKLWKEGARLATDMRDPEAILHDYRHLFGSDFHNNAEYGRRIVNPTLILGGTADQFFDRAACEETAGLIPGADLQLFEGETHMLPVEKSNAVASAITGFLRSS